MNRFAPHFTRGRNTRARTAGTALAVATIASLAAAPASAASRENAEAAAGYTAMRLPLSPNGLAGFALDINNQGVVVGFQKLSYGGVQATKWVPRTEPDGSRRYTVEKAVSAKGAVTGIDDNGRMLAALEFDGVRDNYVVDARGLASKVVHKGQYRTQVTTISTSLLAGWWLTDPDPNIPEVKALGGLLWRNPAAAPTTIPGLKSVVPAGSNDKGVVVGNVNRGDLQTKAFRYQNGVMSFLGSLGGGVSRAAAVNEAGAIVGTATDWTGSAKPYVWTGTMRALATGDRRRLEPTDINDKGVIVGSDDDSVGVYWSSASALPMKLPVPAGTYAGPKAINNDGVIAGNLTITYPNGYPATMPAVWVPR